MKKLFSPADLLQAYEGLRAHALGQLPAGTPRGLALFLDGGMPAWMSAWVQLAPCPIPPAPAGASDRPPLDALGGELVRVLTEMALGRNHGYLPSGDGPPAECELARRAVPWGAAQAAVALLGQPS
ncbi:MAG TPA: hypothetical protein VNF24_08010 [Candidatus Acidoferrales bacterium]|nr:hypothetical protein [Candidatus Acidoferrales bacterium]